MSAHTDEFLGELRLGRRLTTVGQVAAGGLAIAAGLLFLLSGPAMTLIGPQAALAGVLAGIVLGLTLLSVRELLGGSGERGGTYILIQETLGGWGAFIAGWSILSGCIALSAALAQATAGHFVLLFPSIQVPSTAIALAIFAILVLVQLFQVLPRRTLLWPVVVILLIALAVIVLTVLPRVSPRVYRTTPASDLRDLMRSTAWLAASYAALEAILASRRQIRDPGHHLSPAMLGVLLVGSLVFAAITLVGAGLSSPAAPVEATLASILSAASPLPPWIVGALAVAVMSLATSGCLMTAARQMHCLSREGGLPRGLRRPQRPFPMPPLLFGVLTAVTGLLIVLAPARLLTDLAAGTFLLAMILLNVAAIHSHRVGGPSADRLVGEQPVAVPWPVELPGVWATPAGSCSGGSVCLRPGAAAEEARRNVSHSGASRARREAPLAPPPGGSPGSSVPRRSHSPAGYPCAGPAGH
jgi:amino acid transporter